MFPVRKRMFQLSFLPLFTVVPCAFVFFFTFLKSINVTLETNWGTVFRLTVMWGNWGTFFFLLLSSASMCVEEQFTFTMKTNPVADNFKYSVEMTFYQSLTNIFMVIMLVTKTYDFSWFQNDQILILASLNLLNATPLLFRHFRPPSSHLLWDLSLEDNLTSDIFWNWLLAWLHFSAVSRATL